LLRLGLRLGSFKTGQIGELDETPGLSAGAWQMRPLSRSYVEAKSNPPGDAPAINPRYLSEEPTAARSSAACVWRAGCFAAPALQRFVREETLPALNKSRPTTNCSTTRGATAAPDMTSAVPA
jgi:hypothetical protein